VINRPRTTVEQYTGAEEDAALVARVVAGDSRAFDQLFDNHYSRIYNFVAHLIDDRDAAEDIAQMVFVRVYRVIGALRDRRAFLQFAYRVAVTWVRDRARRARRKPWVSLRDMLRHVTSSDRTMPEPAEFADRTLDPSYIVEHFSLASALGAAIAELPDEFREVIVLHHIEGLDVAQIAEVIKAPVGTVKSRLGRARGRLRTVLREWTCEQEQST
jgi:RNA polymerase sigma-70 factor, ECF subfamily